MRAAIPKLERRLKELEDFPVGTIQSVDDPRIDSIDNEFEATLVAIFGNDTAEYHRYRHSYPSTHVHGGMYGLQDALRLGIAESTSTLRTIIKLFAEELGDLGESPSARALGGLNQLDLHPQIRTAAGDLFANGHHANAVEDACKALDALVRIASGRHDLSGTNLMQTVFSPNSPILRFNDLRNDQEKGEQQGMMFLYAGVMLAFRNPRAHQLLKDDPQIALELIGLINLLAKYLGKARKQ